ncbi:hypothetical protein [Halobacillus sp. BBL2006]|uniref:hypothetical protein n=1 Tax=Halobacillus sp. BBL2006 TaxID=1543706 RepID=UPI000543EFFC|nr:hypothetical protein [Halobacillus sp. BBL2006]KHE71498.1 hypothetical protein LD39_09470 [Halobacillus sp. BBL2006]
MKKKLLILTMSLLFSTGMLAACNVDNNEMNEPPQDVNYDPMRYDDNNNDADYRRDRDMDRGMDRDRDHIRQPGERDTPYNMDEEEPDLDEEPSEQRRGE